MIDTQTIAYFRHGIGNLVMLSPALRALANTDPSGKIDILMSSDWNDTRRPAIDDILSRWDMVQSVVSWPTQPLTKKYARWFYTMHAEDSPALVEMKKHNSRAMSVPNWVAEYANETMYYLNVVDNMGWLKGPLPPLEFPVDESGPVIEAPAVALCNGTFDKKMRNGKQWPHFAELARVLKLFRPDVKIVKVGFGDELRDVVANVNYVGKLSITQTAKVLRQCSLVVTVDTALMHVADALGVPTVAIFGGSLVSKNGPINANVRVVRKGLPCQPCQGNGAEFCNCAHANCLSHLSVGGVMHHVRNILS